MNRNGYFHNPYFFQNCIDPIRRYPIGNLLRVLALSLVWNSVSIIATPPVVAQSETPDWQVGDIVRFWHSGEDRVGTIVGISPTMGIRIEFSFTAANSRIISRVQCSSSSIKELIEPGSATTSALRQWRTWIDTSGSSEFEAVFIDLKDEQVKLRKRDGVTVNVALDQLSEECQKAARELYKETESEASNPFRSVETPAASSRSPRRSDPFSLGFDFQSRSEFAGPPKNVPSYPHLKDVKFSFTGAGGIGRGNRAWNPLEPKFSETQWKLGQKFTFTIDATHAGPILIDPANPNRIAASFVNSNTRFTYVVFIDVSTGKTLGPFELPVRGARMVAWDGVRNRLATAWASSTVPERRMIDLWKVSKGPSLEHLAGFYPFNTSSGNYATIHTGQFLERDRLALLSSEGLGIFDLAKSKVVVKQEMDRNSSPLLSRDRKYMIGVVKEKLVFVELNLGRAVSETSGLGIIAETFGFTAFSPDLKKHAMLLDQDLLIFDLETGKLLQSLFVEQFKNGRPQFIDDENLFINLPDGRKILVHLPLKSPIWSYSEDELVAGLPGSNIWFRGTQDSKQSTVSVVQIPEQEAREFIDQHELRDMVVLKPGDVISLDLAGAGAAANELSRKLDSRGFQIAHQSPLKFVATASEPKATQKQYPVFSPFDKPQTLTISHQSYELALMHHDEKIWHVTGESGGVIQEPRGLFGDPVASQELYDKTRVSAAEFFASIEIPDRFIRMPPGGAYGSSVNGKPVRVSGEASVVRE